VSFRRGARAVGLALVALLAGTALAAQIPDSSAIDSLHTARDTALRARYAEGEALAKVPVPVFPRLLSDGVQPAGALTVLDRNSLEWSGAETVSGLLLEIPGVYLWRGGWIGRPEYASYQGRGATSVEYYLDGLPVMPMGPDSVGVDPALLPLRLLDRVEIERWAGLLRVRMYTPRQADAAAATSILVARGDRSMSRYGGSIQKRYQSGLGYGLAANYWNVPTNDAASSAATDTDLWVQLGYLRSDRWGVQYQLMGQAPNRSQYVTTAGDTIGAGVKGNRSDMQLRAFVQGGHGDLSRRLDLVLSHDTWSGNAVDQQVNGVGILASWRKPTLSFAASGFARSQWARGEVRGTVGWAPTRALSASAEAAWLSYDNGRHGQWLAARGGALLPFGFGLSASARLGQVVAAPWIAANAAQDVRDFTGTVSWQRSWISLQADLSSTSEFQPLAPQPYLQVASLAPTPATTWVTVGGRITPVPWIILESRYSNPTTGTPNGNPPTHSMSTATIHSKFFRTFPSGSFELKAQLGVESWGAGVLGLDASAQPIELRGATFLTAYLEIAIGSFRFYYDRGNLAATQSTYVPGFVIPPYGTTYGVRWSFVN
jgi:hypothetical protein